MDYSNFVFYGSWRDTLEGFRADFGDDYAKEALWNLMLAATGNDIETTKRSIIGWIQGACLPNIAAAQIRYEKAKNGGRPNIELDKEDCLLQKARLGTWKAVAEYYDIDEKTLRRIRNSWEEDGTGKTGKTEKPDIDIQIEKEKEKQIDNSIPFNQEGWKRIKTDPKLTTQNQPKTQNQEEKEEKEMAATSGNDTPIDIHLPIIYADGSYTAADGSIQWLPANNLVAASILRSLGYSTDQSEMIMAAIGK